MKNRIIASIVGGIIIFLWQFCSWTALGLHDGAAKYNPQQTEIMNTLSSHFTESGTYMIPTVPPGSSKEEHQKLMKEMEDKPYASVTYVKSWKSDMTMPMIRGFLVDIFLVFLLIYGVTRGGIPSMVRWIAASVSIGLFSWLWTFYMGHIWYQIPWDTIRGDLVDAIVAWGLCGIWLGWFYNRRRAKA